MNETERLRKLANKKEKKGTQATKLGDILHEIVNNRISPRQERFEKVTNCFRQLLPEELASHCRIMDIAGGQLKIGIDIPSYRYEMQLCSRDILRDLQRRCPSAHIKKIKLVAG